jgi:hypothetical protein
MALGDRARAQDSPSVVDAAAHTYALIVGSNPGGEGQAELHYAENDAEHLAEVLRQLGHFTQEHTRVLLGPTRATLLDALDDMARLLTEHRARAEQAQFVFYYSGHARASSLQLGPEALELTELRQRILALPTTITLIVLDACQSGAFSNVKGVQPAAAFSYNSVARLRTSGVAVMASSSASELSQESEALHGSYFTHHLLVGLRGAGDRDKDGVVSLAEAYRYAYERTLSATSRTAVGGQHVTLETALTGQGEVPITYPARAGAQLELGAGLDADVVVEQRDVIVAELHKVAGSSMRLALPAGSYKAVLRRNGVLAECVLALADATLTPLLSDSCKLLDEVQARTKGYYTALRVSDSPVPQPRAARETWAIDLNVGLGGSGNDAYTARLAEFDFGTELLNVNRRYQLAVSRQLGSHLSAVVDVRNLDTADFSRDLQAPNNRHVFQEFTWWSLAIGGHLRVHVDAGRFLRFYAQLGLGPGFAFSTLGKDKQTQLGPVLSSSVGMFWMPYDYFGFVFQTNYAYAPILRNEIGDVHDSGGLCLSLGLRFRLQEGS